MLWRIIREATLSLHRIHIIASPALLDYGVQRGQQRLVLTACATLGLKASPESEFRFWL